MISHQIIYIKPNSKSLFTKPKYAVTTSSVPEDPPKTDKW
jgi:hypothetical protein